MKRYQLQRIFWFHFMLSLIKMNFYVMSENYVHVSPRDLDGNVISLRNMIVNFEHKLAFCPIQKSGSSLWHQLFLRMDQDPHWYEPPWHKPVTSFRSLNISTIERIMNDPSWTKAIFFRDPARRLLSAYTYLIVHDGDPRLRQKFVQQAGSHPRWKTFVSLVVNHTNPNPLRDLHFRPQTDFCRFSKFYKLYNFIGTFEKMSLEGRMLLQQQNIWNSYGSLGWSIAGQIKTNILRKTYSVNDSQRYTITYPPNYNINDCMFCDNNSPHQTNYSAIFLVIDEESKGNRSQPMHEVISYTIWDAIHRSRFYHQDYQILKVLSQSGLTRNSSKFISPYLGEYLRYLT